MSAAVTLPIVRERPILFSSPMVKALLAGQKTVTRRICRVQPEPWTAHHAEGGCHRGDWRPAPCVDGTWDLVSTHAASTVPGFGRSPFGVPGDRLWVKESCWLKSTEVLLGNTIEFGEDVEHTGRVWCGKSPDVVPPEPDEPPHVWYGADGDLPEMPESMVGSWGLRWDRRNSIHMPRWASRITLKVTDVRVERLHDITDADAIAEGIERSVAGTFYVRGIDVELAEFGDARTAFSFLWDGINGERADWESNPFVWRVAFSVLSTTRPA